MIEIRDYQQQDERGWLECRLLSFFYSPYYDDVQTRKSVFSNPVIDLVAVDNDRIVGFIEIECELEQGTVCEDGVVPAGMIWNLGVLSEYRRQGIAGTLLREAVERARLKGIVRLEAYTRDDRQVLEWYSRKDFRPIMSYLHVYIDDDEITELIGRDVCGMVPVRMMAHYTGPDQASIQKRFKRVHRCHRLQLLLDASE